MNFLETTWALAVGITVANVILTPLAKYLTNRIRVLLGMGEVRWKEEVLTEILAELRTHDRRPDVSGRPQAVSEQAAPTLGSVHIPSGSLT